MEKYDLSLLTSSDFEKYIEQGFLIHHSPGQVLVANLIQVTEFTNYSRLKRMPFSLVFQTKGEFSALPQGTYAVEDPMGTYAEIFLVPIGPGPVAPDPAGMRYEAIFS